MRSHFCGEVAEQLVGDTVTLCGWVHRRRDHGGVIFIDLRDRSGLMQVVIDPDTPDTFATAEQVRGEYVLRVTGRVRPRPPGTENPDLPTGRVEMLARSMEVLNSAETPPFQLDDDDVNEEARLRFRYIDIRRPAMQEALIRRASITRAMRDYLDKRGFVDIETPMLTKATPEGARDYLVPSRTHSGNFFALPQSPQIFKQLLMMGGMERYYQIVRCFRDEDLRADRQPEFTQLDVETSFLDQESIMQLMEGLVRYLFKTVLEVDLPDPFPRLEYAEAMRRFGSDRPDLRIPLELVEVADLVADCDFKVFAGPAKDAGGRVAALRVPKGNEMPRSQIDEYTKYVGQFGARGLAYIKVNDVAAGAAGLQSPIVKFLSETALAGIIERTGAGNGDLIFFGADRAKVVNDALGALRARLGQDLGLVEPGWRPLWVTAFPMFEWNAEEKRWDALHHPFTSPDSDDPAHIEAEPGSLLSRAYDVVLNGTEVGGGSVRIHRQGVQRAVFRALGIGEDEARAKFGFLLDALKYGCPPHGGIAFGLDRLAMLMLGRSSIREVIAFPKTQTAACPLTGAPSPADERALRELGIRLRTAPGEAKKKIGNPGD